MNAVMVTTTISALLALIGIGSSLAFNDIISITVVGLYASYLVPLTLLLLRRSTKGHIRSASETPPFESTVANTPTPNAALVWGPFQMPSLLGAIINFVAIVYMVIIFLFAFWPPAQPVGPASMNYACLVFGATVLLSVTWYLGYARRVYRGPVVEIER